MEDWKLRCVKDVHSVYESHWCVVIDSVLPWVVRSPASTPTYSCPDALSSISNFQSLSLSLTRLCLCLPLDSQFSIHNSQYCEICRCRLSLCVLRGRNRVSLIRRASPQQIKRPAKGERPKAKKPKSQKAKSSESGSATSNNNNNNNNNNNVKTRQISHHPRDGINTLRA
jgi:hypothetical protein